MKTRIIYSAAIIFAAALLTSLTACNKLTPIEQEAEAAANAAEPVAAEWRAKEAVTVATAKKAVTAAQTGAFSKEYMIGKWADVKDNSCMLAQDFKADGTVDGVFDSWSVSGSELHAMISGEKIVFAVTVVDRKNIDVVSPQGKKSRLFRC